MEFQLILTGVVLWVVAFVARMGANSAMTYSGKEALTSWAWTVGVGGLLMVLCGIWWNSF